MIKSLVRGIKILDLLAEKKVIGVPEVAAFFQINRSNAFRLLETLRTGSLVEKDKATKKYEIGVGILKYSSAFTDNSLGKIIHPYLVKLNAITKENAHYCVFSGDRVIVIDQINSREILSCNAQIGQEDKMYCTSVGKVILAFLPDEIQERIINSMELIPLTDKTITSKDVLREHLKKIRSDGYAIDNEENMDWVRCLAAPIRNQNGEVNCCVGMSAPAMRLEVHKFPEYAGIVKNIAAEISARLGYTGGSSL